MARPSSGAILALALLALLALPAAASAEGTAGAGGLAAFATIGGGGAAGGSESDASNTGILEAEVGVGWELAGGYRPELALLVGLAPEAYLGVRPGLRYALEGMPFFLRGALDFANPGSSWRMRWVLAGAGAELRITGQLSAYGEADLGIPVASKAGFLVELRGGVGFRF